MNINKIKSLLASVEFDILDNKSIKIESLANEMIENKSRTVGNRKDTLDPVSKMASRVSSVLVRGDGELKDSIHYGYLAIGSILGSVDRDYIGERVSYLMSSSILSDKDSFLSKNTMDKISFINDTYYRFIPVIRQNELGKDRAGRLDIKISTLEKLEKKLGAQGLSTKFISYAVDEVNAEIKGIKNPQLDTSVQSPNMSLKR